MIRLFVALLSVVMLVLPLAQAQEQPVRFEAAADGRGWLVSAELEPPRSPRLEDAAMKGIPLHFVLEVELLRSRWYWWDQRIAQFSGRARLSYHALAREFRVVRDDGPSVVFESFDSALAAMAQVRGWRVELADPLTPGDYVVQARLRLDPSHLPRPLQVDALTNRDWNPQVEWMRASFTLPATPTSAR